MSNNIPLFDRDLSWLTFNYRVLMEAKDDKVPLLERLRFIAIYSSNLDEFFRVRVASVRRIQSLGKKKINKKLPFEPNEVLDRIHQEVNRQLHEYGQVLTDVIIRLKENGLMIHRHIANIPREHREELNYYFKTKILAFLQPRILSEKKPPFLNNKALYFAVRTKEGQKEEVFVLNIPSEKVPRFYSIKGSKNTVHYYFIDDIIRLKLKKIFPGKDILECNSFKLNKDADLQIDDEFSGDLVQKIEKQIRKRNLGDPSRFLYDHNFSEELLEIFSKTYGFRQDELVSGGKYHNLNDFLQVRNFGVKQLEYMQLKPVINSSIESFESIFDAIGHKDQILHFPYQSYDYILQFFNEAAIDPDVREIYVTFYRMAKDSVIGDALISAAANGKKVRVFMEVKARFDEENNLRWATKMRDAGISIQYSMPGLKVHAKVALVKKVIKGKTRLYGFFGTGNLNESTAKIYCDHGLLTVHKGMTKELLNVFQFLHTQKTPEKPFKDLIVSQFQAMESFSKLIDREINHVKSGKKGEIIIKLNNLEEPNLIAKLYEAAEAGVKVQIMARSICCLVPGVSGIMVSRIVDRYLEHARLFWFANDGKDELYMGSSDWMNRNLHRRVEVTFPVYDPGIKEQLIHILKLQFDDNTKRVMLDEEINNISVNGSGKKINAQIGSYDYIKSLNSKI